VIVEAKTALILDELAHILICITQKQLAQDSCASSRDEWEEIADRLQDVRHQIKSA
jgi:hypothetical protein